MRLLLIAVILFCSNLGKANSNISLLGSFAYNQEISDVWGYTDEFGNEYALVGAQKGFSIVDVTTPSNPVEVFYQSGYKSTWRDIKVYNDHAYITNETNGGLLIVDMSPLPQNTTLQVDSFLVQPICFLELIIFGLMKMVLLTFLEQIMERVEQLCLI